MRQDRVMRWLVVVGLVVALDRPADACSPGHTYMPPTNFELVATSPRIVIAKAVGTANELVELEVTRVLKGTAKVGERVHVRGSVGSYLGPSDKTDFSRARRGAYRGGCTASDYKLDRHYLLLLHERAGRWHTRSDPFTRVNEEVDPTSDAWTTAVETYVTIAALPVAQRAKAIDVQIAKQGTPTEKTIAEDLARHRATPSPLKPFAELEAMYRAHPDSRGRIVQAIGIGGDQAAKPFMKQLVQGLQAWTSTVDAHFALPAIGAYYLQVSDPPTLATIAELYVTLGTKQKELRWDVMWMLIHRADASHQAVMERALEGADDEEAGALAQFFARSPSQKARRDLARRVGDAYVEKSNLAFGLAALGDKDILAWAKKQLAAKPDDNRWVALYVIAISPLAEADVLAGKVIAKGGTDVESLVQGYEKATHPRAAARLAALAKNPKLPAETRKWLERTLAERAD